MRRQTDVSMLCVPVSIRERLLLDELKGDLNLDSDANLVRTALHYWAAFQRPGAIDHDMFRLRKWHGDPRKKVGPRRLKEIA